MKPKLFIASSTEGLNIARALQLELEGWAETTLWTQGVFRPSSTVLDDLINISNDYDCAVFVFSADDIIKIREQQFSATRDNVVFELGLFIGKLGKERTFLIVPKKQESFHLPSDLQGLTYLPFDSDRTNLHAALGPACTRIMDTMRSIGALPLKKKEEDFQQLLKTVRRIVELHQPRYAKVRIDSWLVIHSIDGHGNGNLHEEFTLTPEDEPLYFYLLESNYLEREYELSIKLTARNDNGVPLSLLELGRSQGIITHAIVLDQPARKEKPQRLIIDCVRQFLWKDLVEKGEDHGALRIVNKVSSVHFQFNVPPGRAWRAFTRTPELGQTQINRDTITWDIEEPDPGRLSYKLFLE
jgi:hypothetical protein